VAAGGGDGKEKGPPQPKKAGRKGGKKKGGTGTSGRSGGGPDGGDQDTEDLKNQLAALGVTLPDDIAGDSGADGAE